MTEPQRSALLRSLLAAVDDRPDDPVLRVHVAGLLLEAGDATAALDHCSRALVLSPGDPEASALLATIAAAIKGGAPPPPEMPTASAGPDFDWARAEAQMQDVAAGPVEEPSPPATDTLAAPPGVRLDDVGGLEHVKTEIRQAFLVPMANPELRAAYGSVLGGGLLLYGPPGCGKTFIGRALAGELGANFYPVSLADVLDMYIGQSERNIHAVFETARAHRPSVIFFDEVDAIGQKRANLRFNQGLRGSVNQFLIEMDGAQSSNDGVYVLGASNQPWDVDPALRRPGRFDRTVFVPPPDLEARRCILRNHLANRPTAELDVDRLAARTEGFSGADLAHLCEVATRQAFADAARSGVVRPVTTGDFEVGLSQLRPSTTEWLNVARNIVSFGNQDGTYDELAAFLRMKRR